MLFRSKRRETGVTISDEVRQQALEQFKSGKPLFGKGVEKKWDKKYPAVIKSWRNNWHKLCTFFKYPAAIRKLIYTTNTIEGYHRQIRKVTKTKGAFPSDMALLKLIYLASERIEEKWKMPLAKWGITAQQLSIIFGERMKLTL